MTPNIVPSTFPWHRLCNTDHRTFSFLSVSLSCNGFPMHAFFVFYLKSKIIKRNVRNRRFKNCENTEQSVVLVCVFREVRDFIEVWIVNEHRVTAQQFSGSVANTPPALASWRCAKASVRSGRTHLKQPRCLGIFHSWDALKQSRLFSRFSFQETLHELGLSNKNPEDFQPLPASWQRRVSSPNDSIGFHSSCCSCEDVDSPRRNSQSVPHVSLAVVQRNLCVASQFLLQNAVDLEHPVWWTDDVHVVKESEHLLARQQPSPDLSAGPVHPSANKSGVGGSPCSPPWTCGMSWEVPVSSSPQVRGWTATEHPHEGEDLISLLHPQKALQHSLSGDQIVRSDSVYWHHSGFCILIGQSVHDVCDAFTSSLGRQGVLEGSSGFLNLCGHLLGHGSCHESP